MGIYGNSIFIMNNTIVSEILNFDSIFESMSIESINEKFEFNIDFVTIIKTIKKKWKDFLSWLKTKIANLCKIISEKLKKISEYNLFCKNKKNNNIEVLDKEKIQTDVALKNQGEVLDFTLYSSKDNLPSSFISFKLKDISVYKSCTDYFLNNSNETIDFFKEKYDKTSSIVDENLRKMKEDNNMLSWSEGTVQLSTNNILKINMLIDTIGLNNISLEGAVKTYSKDIPYI